MVKGRSPNAGLLRRVFSEAELAEPLEALAAWLEAAGSGSAAGNGEAAVAAVEARYGVRLPEDFRRYLVEVAPGEELTDGELTTWWPLGRIRSLPEEYDYEISHPAIAAEAGGYLFFADYILWCWAWAVCCSEGPDRGRVVLIGGAPDGFVADSFSDFVRRYLSDPDDMANTLPGREDGPQG